MQRTNEPLQFFVTSHARKRYEERIGGGKKDVAPEIVKIIREGMDAGRKAKRKPIWLGYTDYRPRNRAPEIKRYVWDVHEQVCFLVAKRTYLGKKVWYVITTFSRRPGR